MVNIEFNNELKQLQLQCSGQRFSEEIESLKFLKAIYNPSLKKWLLSPNRLNEIIDEMKQFGISISEYDKQEINNYLDNLKELKSIVKRSEYRRFQPELMKLPPK
jgi:hypothetical protein